MCCSGYYNALLRSRRPFAPYLPVHFRLQRLNTLFLYFFSLCNRHLPTTYWLRRAFSQALPYSLSHNPPSCMRGFLMFCSLEVALIEPTWQAFRQWRVHARAAYLGGVSVWLCSSLFLANFAAMVTSRPRRCFILLTTMS